MNPLDTLGRPLRDLRISVTDRCNFRCTYCMPKEVFGRDYQFLERGELLSFEEIERVARSFVRHGVRKLRLTGGEPLLRKGIEDLVAKLALIPDVKDLTLTTNGSLLARKAKDLAAAGLHRVTVSLDSMDDTVFMAMNDVGFGVQTVLDGIAAAAEAGLTPVKINMVVKRGVNDDSILDMARYFKGSSHTLRFIESSSTWTSAIPTAGGSTMWFQAGISSRCWTGSSESSRWVLPTGAKWPSAGVTETELGRWVSSPRSPSHSAVTAPGLASRPRVSSTPVSSLLAGPTCARYCGRVRTMRFSTK